MSYMKLLDIARQNALLGGDPANWDDAAWAEYDLRIKMAELTEVSDGTTQTSVDRPDGEDGR